VALHAWCAAALGLTQLLSGAPDEAKEVTTGAYDLARRHGYRPIEVHTSRLLGEIAAEYGGAATAACAETWFRDAAALARELGMQPELAHCHRDLGELFARIGRPVEAQAALAAAAKLYRSTGMQPYAAQVEAALAELGKGASGILAAFDVSKRVVLNLSATNINQEKEGKRQ
jgi:hypothetical protein